VRRYRATITPIFDFQGNATIRLAANKYNDNAGNSNLASNALVVQVDTVQPCPKAPICTRAPLCPSGPCSRAPICVRLPICPPSPLPPPKCPPSPFCLRGPTLDCTAGPYYAAGTPEKIGVDGEYEGFPGGDANGGEPFDPKIGKP
jgi:hypothetical protein